MMGLVTPGKRASSHYKNRALYRDGVPAAFRKSETRLLSEFDQSEEWNIK